MATAPKMRVAVIGAGASGLASIKCCIDEGLEPECFEMCHDIGGNWLYSENENAHSSVYQSTIINTSKEMNAYSDCPMPKELAPFMTHEMMMIYFRLYAERFDLLKYIKFNTEITKVNRAPDYQTTGRWEVHYESKTSSGIHEERCKVFDAVMVCTGHLWQPRWASFPGQDRFTGRQMHSHSYKHFRGFEGKTIVVIGLGNSAGDIACELSRHAKMVYISTRRGAWVRPRSVRSLPCDYYHTRFNYDLPSWFRTRYRTWLEIKNLNYDNLGLKPAESYFSGASIINEDIETRIITGTLKIKPDIKKFTARGVQFVDGSVIQGVDVVIHCTGYHVGFSFLDESVIELGAGNDLNLYKFVFPLDEPKSTIAFIGYLTVAGSMNPVFEIQARWVTRVFKGTVKLPPRQDMREDIRRKKEQMLKDFADTPRHAFEVNGLPYMDEIGSIIGCRPSLWRLLFTDPKFALRCYFGPAVPAQWRLHGPGKWPGAKATILKAYDHLIYPTRSRVVVELEKKQSTFRRRVAVTVIGLTGLAFVLHKVAARYEVVEAVNFEFPWQRVKLGKFW